MVAECEAKQFGDAMICGTCCMMWTVHDKIKPTCGKQAAAVAKAAKARADEAIAKSAKEDV